MRDEKTEICDTCVRQCQSRATRASSGSQQTLVTVKVDISVTERMDERIQSRKLSLPKGKEEQ
jgi:hypothetical protein